MAEHRSTSDAPTIAPYGSWKSPISSQSIVSGTVGLGSACVDGAELYWSEARPSEGGRTAIVRWTGEGDATEELLPMPYNARTRVHEYGGGAWCVAEGWLYFVHDADQRLYRLPTAGGDPQPMTPAGQDWRYADFELDRDRDRLIAVRERHGVPDAPEAINDLVAIALDGSHTVTALQGGHDFFATPRLSPDGQTLAWLTWDHPNLPWDGTELWTAPVAADGTVGAARRVAGGPDESIFQPSWSPDGVLYFVSDRTGWWNLYREKDGAIEPLYPLDAEFGLPQWVFGMSTYGFASATRLICAYTQEGVWSLAELNLTSGRLSRFDLPYTAIEGVTVAGDRVLFKGGSALQPTALVQLALAEKDHSVLKYSSVLDLDRGYLSEPKSIEFPTGNGKTAFGLLYLPQNRDYQAPEGEKPPLKVKIHGGPTAQTSSSLNLSIQYWTSRGFAVFDINYGGSTGYGREYRQRLDGNWGVVDVDDCAHGAQYLVDRGLVDGDRLTIAGGSAGGYTTLAVLAFRDTFKAGASYYGVSELEALARDTHKFESRYLDRLIGPYPERRDIYVARSPLTAVDQLSCPVIFFQGLEDKIVPPNQAEMMVEALRKKGIPVAYVPFAGEQHGFRQAANVKRSLDGEFYFYARVFGFAPADEIEPIAIDNLAS